MDSHFYTFSNDFNGCLLGEDSNFIPGDDDDDH